MVGRSLSFMVSTNESRSAWDLNYEIVWADASEEGIRWVQEEFEALWGHQQAVDLAEAVVQDVERLARRVIIPDVPTWKETLDADPAAAVVELPVYRRENGLWAHQKCFIRLAFELHRRGGARLVLADQVGLGKTVQLALAACCALFALLLHAQPACCSQRQRRCSSTRSRLGICWTRSIMAEKR
jgi:hypothetical protein